MERHYESHTRLYKIWADIKTRCYTPSCVSYPRYGERGIKMCEEWRNSYISFRDWAKSVGYNDDLTIERLNVDGDYTPENCTFIPWKEQFNNKRNTIYFKAISPTGEIFYDRNIANFSREHNLHRKMVLRVIHKERKSHRGWTFEKIENNKKD